MKMLLYIVHFCLMAKLVANQESTTSSAAFTPAATICANNSCGNSTQSTSALLNVTLNTTISTPITTSSPLTTTCSSGACGNTTTKPTQKSFIAPTFSPEIVKNFKTSTDICTCNLQVDICDINCCCDTECNMDEKSIFAFCQDKDDLQIDTKYCKYVNYSYLNNSRFEWQIQQNSLLCIEKSNLPRQYISQKKQKITTLSDANKIKHNKYKWNDIKGYNKAEKNFKFHYGSPLWIIRNNSLEQFELPSNFITNICLKTTEIFFLQNLKSECNQKDVANKLLDPQYYQNISFVKNPTALVLSLLKKNLTKNFKNLLLPINAKICSTNFENCVNYSKIWARECHLDPLTNTLNCNNLVENVKYVLFHNGSHGFMQIDLLLSLKNISDSFDEFSQSFEVNFYWANSTLNLSSILSGNPGYVVGKPILTANLIYFINFTNDTKKNETIKTVNVNMSRNPAVLSDNFLLLPANKNGICALNNYFYTTVEFNYNLITKCKLNRLIFPSKNANASCIEIQKLIFRYWSLTTSNSTNFNKLFGTFGNANLNNVTDWNKIIFEKSPQEIFNETSGSFTNANQTLICRNLSTAIIIEIFHSRVHLKKDQEKIVAITIRFKPVDYTAFEIKQKGETVVDTELKMSVWFFDITSDKIEKFVEPPSFQIRLPYDFFYPFVKVQNGVERLNVIGVFSLLGTILVLKIFIG